MCLGSSVDNHIPRDDIFDYQPLKNVIFMLYLYTVCTGVTKINDTDLHYNCFAKIARCLH